MGDNELTDLLGDILGDSDEEEIKEKPKPAPKQAPKPKPRPAPRQSSKRSNKTAELEKKLNKALEKIEALEKKSKRNDNIFEIVKQSYEIIYNSNITRYTNAKATGMLNSLKIVKSYFDN